MQIFIDFITNTTANSSDRPLVGIQAFNFDYIDLSKTEEAWIRGYERFEDSANESEKSGSLQISLQRQYSNLLIPSDPLEMKQWLFEF